MALSSLNVWFCDILIRLNHLNKVTRNLKVIGGCSEISISVIVKHKQQARIIRAFCLPGVTYQVLFNFINLLM